MIALAQNKLDASLKKRSNIFNWRGQFTPEFAEYILGQFTSDNDFVIDPFSGSGTVLCEASRLNLSCAGFEINPTAFYMSSFFKLAKKNEAEREAYITAIEERIFPLINNIGDNIPVYEKTDNYRDSYSNLLNFIQLIKPLFDEDEYIFILNLLFLTEKDKKKILKDSLFQSHDYLKDILYKLPYYPNNLIETHLCDARKINEFYSNKADLIFTSPPYINVFNYHQNYRGIIELFEYDILSIANSEFGANRKHRGNRFKTVLQYTLDMAEAIFSFSESLKLNGKLVLVVGRESNVLNTPFYNSQIIIDILSKLGIFEIMKFDRQFNNKFGNTITEDIIVASKINSLYQNVDSYDIAINHLSKALDYCPQSAKKEIEDVIKNPYIIKASPKI